MLLFFVRFVSGSPLTPFKTETLSVARKGLPQAHLSRLQVLPFPTTLAGPCKLTTAIIYTHCALPNMMPADMSLLLPGVLGPTLSSQLNPTQSSKLS